MCSGKQPQIELDFTLAAVSIVDNPDPNHAPPKPAAVPIVDNPDPSHAPPKRRSNYGERKTVGVVEEAGVFEEEEVEIEFAGKVKRSFSFGGGLDEVEKGGGKL
ncbi:hypothetical protein V8G54_031136 [Vigna mungo]|uniref:Uncharacterized protein n=1 Tax=Vigna mungo TaxID=3915 RepID=A0AAQ3MYG0_VIGMU